MKTANQIINEATEALDRLASEALAAGHEDTAAFLNKLSADSNWAGPRLDGSKATGSMVEWVPGKEVAA